MLVYKYCLICLKYSNESDKILFRKNKKKFTGNIFLRWLKNKMRSMSLKMNRRKYHFVKDFFKIAFFRLSNGVVIYDVHTDDDHSEKIDIQMIVQTP